MSVCRLCVELSPSVFPFERFRSKFPSAVRSESTSVSHSPANNKLSMRAHVVVDLHEMVPEISPSAHFGRWRHPGLRCARDRSRIRTRESASQPAQQRCPRSTATARLSREMCRRKTTTTCRSRYTEGTEKSPAHGENSETRSEE